MSAAIICPVCKAEKPEYTRVKNLLLHPALTHAQAAEVCRRNGLRVVQDLRGNMSLESAPARGVVRPAVGQPDDAA
jgi:hypothetical protein